MLLPEGTPIHKVIFLFFCGQTGHPLRFSSAVAHFCKICCVSLLLLVGVSDAYARSLTVAAASWRGYTDDDQQGLYFRILREALASQNIQLNVRITNWKRAKHMFYANRADILLADYRHDDPMRFFPQWQLDYDHSVLLYSLQPLQDLQQLKNQPVGWLLGYDFDQYLPVAVQAYEVAADAEGFNLLQHGRLQAFISYQAHQPPVFPLPLYRMEILSAQPLYPVFHNDFSGRQLARAFDQGMARLYRSGRLAELFADEQKYRHARFSEKAQAQR